MDAVQPLVLRLSSSSEQQDDLASDAPAGGSLVGFSSTRKWKHAVSGGAEDARIEQTPEFRELQAADQDISLDLTRLRPQRCFQAKDESSFDTDGSRSTQSRRLFGRA